MKSLDIINVNAILWIEVMPSRDEPWPFRWRNEIPAVTGMFGRIKQPTKPASWVDSYGEPVSVDKILSDNRYCIIENKVYRRACVNVVIQNGKYSAEFFKYFDSDQEAVDWATETSKSIPHIKIEN